MQEQLITFKTARLAYKNNFDWSVANCYNENGELGDESDGGLLINYNGFTKTETSNTNLYSAPSQSLLQRWLREKHNIHMYIIADKPYSFSENKDLDVIWICSLYKPLLIEYGNLKEEYKTYEEALEAGLQEALKLI